MYKEASKQKLRFTTSKGLLSVEQLWELDVNTLDSLAVSLQESYENSKGKSFLAKTSAKDKTIKLQFDIALDILLTKQADSEAAKEAKDNKEFNQKIMGIIQEKNEDALKGKSVKELTALLKK